MNNKVQWIFLRGLARESRHWENLREEWKTKFPSHEVYFFDSPGNGIKANQLSPLNISEYVEVARQELGEFTGPRFLISISMGGMIAIEWMRKYPTEISGTVLINSSFSGLSPLLHRLRLASLPPLVLAICKKDYIEKEKKIISVISNRKDLYEKTAKLWGKYSSERPTSNTNALRQLFAASRYHWPVEPINGQVLILNSLGDRMVNPDCSEILHQKTNWPIKKHPSAGHDLPLDDSPWMLQQILEWYQLNFSESLGF